jgi:hypothetical protein
MAWQKASGYSQRAKAEATINRFKQVIGDPLRAQTAAGQRTEILIGVIVAGRQAGKTINGKDNQLLNLIVQFARKTRCLSVNTRSSTLSNSLCTRSVLAAST